MQKLLEFIDSRYRNAWIYLPKYKLDVYVRKSQRYIIKNRYSCLDIATATISENFRGKGYFTSFLNNLEKTALPFQYLFFENIQTDRLATFLKQKRGYQLLQKGYDLPCFIAPIKKNWKLEPKE